MKTPLGSEGVCLANPVLGSGPPNNNQPTFICADGNTEAFKTISIDCARRRAAYIYQHIYKKTPLEECDAECCGRLGDACNIAGGAAQHCNHCNDMFLEHHGCEAIGADDVLQAPDLFCIEDDALDDALGVSGVHTCWLKQTVEKFSAVGGLQCIHAFALRPEARLLHDGVYKCYTPPG
jgi:hypothetical protein